MKKKKKKQEPIFSALEEIRIEKTEKNIFKQAIIPSEIKETKEVTAVLKPETIAVVLTNPSKEISSVTTVLLPTEKEVISPTITPSLPDFSFVFIPSGHFIMGSPETEPGRSDDELPHEVSITHGYFLQTTPVTQGQWNAVMGDNPARFSHKDDDYPVESVSWYDCQKFIERLNNIGEYRYRLPTEAEWEYACRAGKFSSFSEGEINELFCEHEPNLDAVGWYCGNSDRRTHPVGQKKPNPWGIYDLHGNVLEWCQDWYGPYPPTTQTDPTGPITGSGRVIRGGSWFSNAKNCRSAARFHWSPNANSDFIGFRLVREKRKP
ncbi:MAG: formylglycine-generating enzyme family protein [Thermodesulfobacteriota bacterium]|nr:MAG: formylglycine-generating enzyme family protein [Thermodesulfobacteriota bacterium]